MSYPELKIKIKSLAEEARIIRADEKKLSGSKRESLHIHRVIDVRQEQRSALLAYGFLRGRSYLRIEAKRKEGKPGPNWVRIRDLIAKYGDTKQIPSKSEAYNLLKSWEVGAFILTREPIAA